MNAGEQPPRLEELWDIVRQQRERIEELERTRKRRRPRHIGRFSIVLLTVLSALAVSSNAFASIPSANGVVTFCYLANSANTRIIDAANSACKGNEKSIGLLASGAPIDAGQITGVLPVSHGGTGSNTQNFVDLSTNQTVGGAKTFTDTINGNVHGDVTGNLTGNVTGNVTGDLTGNVTGNVSGNAGTVTNGLYSTGSYGDPAWLTSLGANKITGGTNNADAVSDPAWLTSLSGGKINGDISGNAGGFTGELGGDVTGTQGNTSVTGINGTPVSGTPSGGQVLEYNETAGKWEPESLPQAYTPSVRVVSTSDVAKVDGGDAWGSVACPSGYFAISGGIASSVGQDDAYLVGSAPVEADGSTTSSDAYLNTNWFYSVHNIDPFYDDYVEAYAICFAVP